MSCCGASPEYGEIDQVSQLVSAKLAAFLRTLRDNGFAVGLAEGRDAAALMASGYATRPGLLRSALKHLFSGASRTGTALTASSMPSGLAGACVRDRWP